MAIDITKLKEHNLLSTLGEGDWMIAMPAGYSELVVSTQWRDEIIEWAGTCFVRWVLNGTCYTIHHDNDPSWDHSGEPKKQNIDPLILKTLYSTLGDWLKEEYTGQGIPTYESHYGMSWETYSHALNEHVTECINELLHIQYAAQYAPDPYEFNNAIWEDASLIIVILEQAMSLLVEAFDTTEAWTQFETETRQQIEEEERLSREHSAYYSVLFGQARQFWHTHFIALVDERIELPQFKELGLENRFRELFLDTDPAVVQAIAKVGLPGNFSNSVAEAIKYLAKEAL